MPDYEEYYRGKIINQKGRDISKVEEMLDEADGDPVRPPTAKELRHLAQYSGYEQMTDDTTQTQTIAQQGSKAWLLFFLMFIIGMTLILAKGLGAI